MASSALKMRWKKRLEELYRFEVSLYEQGYNIIAGVDEAGRGALAGPVAVSAVILPKGIQYQLTGLDDSKKVTPRQRSRLYKHILSLAYDVVLVLADERVIESLNILETTKLSMVYAINSLKVVPDAVVVDGMELSGLSQKQFPMPSADSISATVAAASIVAKVTRDRIMERYGDLFCCYNFPKNKGYGTAEHRVALQTFGPCAIHRKSFCLKILNHIS